MSKIQTRIQSADMQAISNIATQKGLKLSTVLDAVIQAGLNEIQSAQRYELLQTGMLIVRENEQGTPSVNRRNQRASTARPKSAVNKARAQGETKSNTDSPLTATTSQTQLPVPTKTPVPPFLTGEMIPAEIYKDLTDYEKKCLGLEAFLLSPDGVVVLRDEPPITSDGTRGNMLGWRTLCAGFISGDDPDNFVGLTWKPK